MGDAGGLRNSWGWGLPSYRAYENEDEPRRYEAPVHVPQSPSMAGRVPQFPALAGRRHSMSAAHYPETPKQRTLQSPSFVNKVSKVKDRISSAREECIELRQEASDLQEYSNAKIERVIRYLGVLAEKARRLDEVALDSESRVTPLKKEKKKLFNDLVSAKGNVRVYGRVRPQFEDEDSTSTSYPDDFTLRLNSNVTSTPSKDFELDRIYGPHISQGNIFQELQPLVQSALDGYNVSIFAYGQTGSGKTYTMEGPSHDRGLYYRAVEELFDMVNTEATPTSRTAFYVTMFELHNDQVRDLLKASDNRGASMLRLGEPGYDVELVDERIDSPSGFTRVFKFGSQMRANIDGVKSDRSNRSHLVVTVHIHTSDSLTGEEQYSKLSMVDLAGSERLNKEKANGDRLTESLHINKSLSALGDVFSALSAKKDYIPYDHSRLTQILADSLGGDSKSVLIVNVSPSNADVQETIPTLNFASRARNAEISLGNRDTIKKWRDMASEARRESYEKEKEATEAQAEVMQLKRAMKEADDQCLLLFGEVQKAWKLASTLQADLTSHELYINKLQVENNRLSDQKSRDQDQYAKMKTQLTMFTTRDEQHQSQLKERGARIEALEVRVQVLEQQLHETRMAAARTLPARQDNLVEIQRLREETENALGMNQRLEEELSKRDELIERLHQENEKLFERLTDRTMTVGSPRVSASPKIPRAESRAMEDFNLDGGFFSGTSTMPAPPVMRSSSSMRTSSTGQPSSPGGAGALLKYGSGEQMKTTPAGEYLTAALMDFSPDQYESDAAIADGANKLLMLVLAAVVKAGASREHEMLAEIQGAVFAFIRRMELRTAMDTMLVSRVRILYIRSLLSRAPELQSLKVPPVERFLEKAGSGLGSGRSSRTSSLGSSPHRSPGHQSRDGGDYGLGFRVNLRQEKRSKFSSVFSKLRGNDQDISRQHVTEGKLKETTEDARDFAIGNKPLASLFVHTPAGELRRQIRGWLAENFDFLSLTGGETISGVSSHLELLSTAILDGWMSGLGVPEMPSTDALGQLLSEYTKMVYTRQLQHLKDVAATLMTEEAEDAGQVTKLRSALESVEHKRRKVLMQMRTSVVLLTDDGTSPTGNPSMDTENARVASLISLEDIYKQAEEICKDAPQGGTTAVKKLSYLKRLDALEEGMSALLSIDLPCAQKCIMDTRRLVESLEEQQEVPGVRHTRSRTLDGLDGSGDTGQLDERRNSGVDSEVIQWSVLQFNNGSATPFVIKCGATSNLELVVKAQAKMQEKGAKEIVAVVPVPSVLGGLSVEDIRQTISHLPESFCQLAMARTADGTRARYTRLYKTLAIRVPALKHVVEDLEESVTK